MSPLNAPPTTATGAARELAVRQGCGGSQPGRLSPRRAHHDQCHSEQGNDRVERSCRLDSWPAQSRAVPARGRGTCRPCRSKRSVRAPPAGPWRLSQLSVVMKSPAQPKPTTARRTSQDSGPSSSGIAAVRDHHPSEGGIGADVPNPLDDRSAAQRGQREAGEITAASL